MLTLIRNATVYAPDYLGQKDILIAGERICAVEDSITPPAHCNLIDADGLIAHPGLVDSLVHITGGGGEGGFHTRTPEMVLTDATLAGVTTVVGALGTDATTRTLQDLVAKTYALRNEGLSAYCYTGSYQLPARTITGSVTDDIVLIDPMIGVGEVAIADHRGSQPNSATLAQLASEARVGGMLSGKGGIVYVHVGDANDQLALLHDAIDTTAVPAKQFYPTHLNRSQSLLDAGIAWTKAGGIIDVTASTNQYFIDEGEIPAADAIAQCLLQGIPADHLSMSSDGNASLPVFDDDGSLTGLEVGKVASLQHALSALVNKENIDKADAITTVTKAPAKWLKLAKKGEIKVGFDADIVLTNATFDSPLHVFCRGRHMVSESNAIVKGTFE